MIGGGNDGASTGRCCFDSAFEGKWIWGYGFSLTVCLLNYSLMILRSCAQVLSCCREERRGG